MESVLVSFAAFYLVSLSSNNVMVLVLVSVGVGVQLCGNMCCKTMRRFWIWLGSNCVVIRLGKRGVSLD